MSAEKPRRRRDARGQSNMLRRLFFVLLPLLASSKTRTSKPSVECQDHEACVSKLGKPAWCSDTKTCAACDSWDSSDRYNACIAMRSIIWFVPGTSIQMRTLYSGR